jgi:membrane-associated phospholipid phosphatase
MKSINIRRVLLTVAVVLSTILLCPVDTLAQTTINGIPYRSNLRQTNLGLDGSKISQSGTVEGLLSYDYGKIVLYDIGHVLSSPIRWRSRDWLSFGAQTLAITLTYASLDKTINTQAQKHRSRTSNNIARTFEPLGRGPSLIPLTGLYIGGLVFKDSKAKAAGLDGFSSMLIASFIITPALKEAFGRGRPSDNLGWHYFKPFGGNTSLPSGHATRAFSIASAIAANYDKTWISALAYGTASLVALSRINDNYHYASDVLAGACIGIAVGRTVVHFNQKLRTQKLPIAIKLF